MVGLEQFQSLFNVNKIFLMFYMRIQQHGFDTGHGRGGSKAGLCLEFFLVSFI